ncbi:hypothetical protein Q6W86_003454 [Salmonella enterica]|nr:hypothetical protein [Salmonella enterica]ELC6623229.1 hypothetical protein [Salmonella enterica]ELC6713723.1 hypothetical protein [Salmonella enterica]ELC6736376.1 hypothetical protein [Salmonella enterica]
MSISPVATRLFVPAANSLCPGVRLPGKEKRLGVPAANSLCPGVRLPGKEKRLGVVIRQRTGYDDSSAKGEHQ